jgi:KDO2-lipid IV(A) lauroyltransferase
LRTQIEYLAARFVLATLSRGPRHYALRLARFYVHLVAALVPRLRLTAIRNLELALPDLSRRQQEQIFQGSCISLARLLVVLARFPQLNARNVSRWIRYDGFEHFEKSLQRGKGVLFATAHLGNWELSAFAHALMAQPMHVVVRALDNPQVNALVEGLRTLSGNRIIEKRDYVRGILRALQRNEAVGILIDQNAGLADGVFIDFFGAKACVDKGFARVAAHSGAAIIPGFALWCEPEQRYLLKFYPPLFATGDIQADTQRIHAVLESVIRQYPDQWLWMHRRWKTRPPGEPPIYG